MIKNWLKKDAGFSKRYLKLNIERIKKETGKSKVS
jgi:hypothetical protein